MVSNHTAIDTSIAIPTMSCAEPVSVNHAIKKPKIVNICAIDSFRASITHLPTNFKFFTYMTYFINSKGMPNTLYKNFINFLII